MHMARNRNMRKATLLERLTFWKVTRRRWTFLVARQPCSNREANLPHGRCCIWQKFYHLFHKGPPSLQSYVLYYASTTINLCFGPSFKPLALGNWRRRKEGRGKEGRPVVCRTNPAEAKEWSKVAFMPRVVAAEVWHSVSSLLGGRVGL